jgi:hypothetical protein
MVEIRGAVLGFKNAERKIKSEINKETRQVLGKIWKEEIEGRVAGMPRVDQLVLGKGASVKAGNPATLKAATSTRPLSGGLVPNDRAKGFEFGTDDRNKTSTYTRRSPKGKSHSVTRRTTRHLPARAPEGRVIWPAFAETGPRIVSLWVQIIVRNLHEAIEGK